MRFKQVVMGCACLIFFLATLAACGTRGGASGGASGGGGQSKSTEKSADAVKGSVVKTIEVKETEYKLKPANINLKKAGTYVLRAVNSGSTTHALEIESKGIEKETKNLNPGKNAALKVTLKPGKYEIYCPVDGHKEKGMEGKITVGKDSGGQGSGSY